MERKKSTPDREASMCKGPEMGGSKVCGGSERGWVSSDRQRVLKWG